MAVLGRGLGWEDQMHKPEQQVWPCGHTCSKKIVEILYPVLGKRISCKAKQRDTKKVPSGYWPVPKRPTSEKLKNNDPSMASTLFFTAFEAIEQSGWEGPSRTSTGKAQHTKNGR